MTLFLDGQQIKVWDWNVSTPEDWSHHPSAYSRKPPLSPHTSFRITLLHPLIPLPAYSAPTTSSIFPRLSCFLPIPLLQRVTPKHFET